MIVVDTGVVFAAADRRDGDHEACLALLDAHPSPELVLPALVAAEASWLIGDRLGAETEAAFVGSDAGLLEAVLAHYRSALAETPFVHTSLTEHGVADGEVVDAFGLGFADRTLGLSLPSGVAGRGLRRRLQALGVLRSTGHEQFRGCLVVPVRDGEGRVVQCFGRRGQASPAAGRGRAGRGAVAPSTGDGCLASRGEGGGRGDRGRLDHRRAGVVVGRLPPRARPRRSRRAARERRRAAGRCGRDPRAARPGPHTRG